MSNTIRIATTIVGVLCAILTYAQTAIISGQITNPKDKYVYLRHYSDYITYTEITVDSAMLSKKGEFRMEFSWPAPGNITFYHGDEITAMYVCPGDNMQLTLDTKEFDESIRYTGKGSTLNTYMAKKYLLTPEFTQALFRYVPDAFAAHMDSVRDLQLAFHSEYFSGRTGLSDAEAQFVDIENQSILYDCASQKLNFPSIYGYVTGNPGYKAEPAYYAFLQHVPLVNASAKSPQYFEFIVDYIQQEWLAARMADGTADPYELRQQLIEKHLAGYPREYVYANWVYETLSESQSPDKADSLYTAVKPLLKTPALIQLLEASFAAYRVISPGNPAPAFTAVSPDGKTFTLSDFLGKVVYLDLWATWCGPCVGEIPALEKLISEMEGTNVVFLSVSVDTDEKAWQKMLKARAMKGTHGISPGNFNAPIAKAYQVNGIPRYVLIDQEGKIANPNAPRPGQVKEELQALLTQ